MRGKPWPAICLAVSDIRRTYEVAVSAAPAIQDAAAKTGETAVLALLERIGATPYDLESPHQALLYQSCARQDYRDAAAQYIRELGGEHALPEVMETWELNHPPLPGN